LQHEQAITDHAIQEECRQEVDLTAFFVGDGIGRLRIHAIENPSPSDTLGE